MATCSRFAALGVLLWACLLAASAHTATFTVTNTADSGAGSLRQAIIDANLNAGPHFIDASGVTGDIELHTPFPSITQSMDIYGPTAGVSTVGGIPQGYMSDVWSYGLHITPDDLPSGKVDKLYGTLLEAREGDGPFVWSLAGGTPPPGLTIDTSSTSDTVSITGTPTAVGTFTFTIKLEDKDGYTAEQPLSIKINPPPRLGSSDTNETSGCATNPAPQIPAAILTAATATAALLRRRRVATWRPANATR
jgi:hypothetical protein